MAKLFLTLYCQLINIGAIMKLENQQWILTLATESLTRNGVSTQSQNICLKRKYKGKSSTFMVKKSGRHPERINVNIPQTRQTISCASGSDALRAPHHFLWSSCHQSAIKSWRNVRQILIWRPSPNELACIFHKYQGHET